MTVEQIAIRQEVRSLLSEAGINRNTVFDEFKKVLTEEIAKAVNRSHNELNLQEYVSRNMYALINEEVRKAVKDAVRDIVQQKLCWMDINITLGEKK